MNVEDILRAVAEQRLTVPEACDALQNNNESNLGFARVDLHRLQRRGFPEVIFCQGKTALQITGIIRALCDAGQNVYGTRISLEQVEEIRKTFPNIVHHHVARAITLDIAPLPTPRGLVMIVAAGTSDLPVAEEAALTAERLGAHVERLFDVGVAGLHRLLHHAERLKEAYAIVAVAGMEGALPSVLGGFVDVPIIAVPTSIGYGVHFQGLAPLLAMLNSCAPGVSVVNIDNGFGAGICAALINRRASRQSSG